MVIEGNCSQCVRARNIRSKEESSGRFLDSWVSFDLTFCFIWHGYCEADAKARGGYVAGGASSFDGNDLIRESGEGVVVVIIQYRLGVFGFLPGQKVKDGGALNAGLRMSSFHSSILNEND